MSRSNQTGFEVGILAAAAACLLVLTAARRPAPAPAAAPTGKMPSGEMAAPQMLYCGLWRSGGSLAAKVHIKNSLMVAPVSVTLTLYMADGTPYILPAVEVPMSGEVTVSLSQALADAPSSMLGHISGHGSATLTYLWDRPGHIAASLNMKDVAHSLSFHESFMIMPVPTMTQSVAEIGPASLRMKPVALALRQGAGSPVSDAEGLWWRRDPGVSVHLGLANSSDSSITAQFELIGRSGSGAGWQTVDLDPHASTLVPLNVLINGLPGDERKGGGIRVQQLSGPATSLQASGWLVNRGEGYSASMEFVSADPESGGSPAPGPITLAAPGLMVGKPMPGGGFPRGLRFLPYGYLRNTTARVLPVTLDVNLAANVMNSSVGGANQKLSLRLAPFELRALPLRALASLLERRIKMDSGSETGAMLNWSASYEGGGGDLLIASGSTDQTGNYVFESMPQEVNPHVGLQLPYWDTSHGNDTMYSIWNPSTSTQNVVLTLYSADGMHDYAIPITLAAGASSTVDVGMLRMEGIPDAGGNLLPPEVEDGSAMLEPGAALKPGPDGKIHLPASGPAEMEVVVNDGVYNPVTATCCNACVYCCFYTCPQVASLLAGVGDSGNSSMTVEDCCGFQNYVTSMATWASEDTSIASSIGGGQFKGIAVGSTFANASVSMETHSASGPYCTGGCKKGPLTGNGGCSITLCGDPPSPSSGDRGALIGEYTSYGVTIVSPQCADFTSSTGTAADGGLLTPNDEFSWALIGLPISHQHAAGVGYDVWMSDYVADTGDQSTHAVNSGYRTPAHNASIGGAPNSAHMAGVAVDVDNNSRTLAEYNNFVTAARQAQAFYVEPTSGHCGLSCTHADWRTSTYSYSGGFAH